MPDEGEYRVSWSRQAVDTLKELGNKVRDAGRRAELGRVVREMDRRLRDDPHQFGEVYRSRGPVDECLAVHGFLAVDFAVDQAQRFVLVRSCSALSGYAP